MNEHARSIYQASLDGKTVQIKQGPGVWQDESPFHHILNPINYGELWRIKPKRKTWFFRVYIDTKLKRAQVENIPDKPVDCIEQSPFFGGWLTNWIPYEVEVEE